MLNQPIPKKRSRFREAFIIGILVSLAVWEKTNVRVHISSPKDDTLTGNSEQKIKTFQYKTIIVPDSSNQLLAYEFHVYKDNYENVDFSCSAIIRKINPAKDNYKLFSKAVIADIMNTMNTNNIEVNIYDDYQAYVLAEQNGGKQFKPLSKEEADSINKHIIATYDNRAQGWYDTMHTVTYYAQAGNKYTEQEPY